MCTRHFSASIRRGKGEEVENGTWYRDGRGMEGEEKDGLKMLPSRFQFFPQVEGAKNPIRK
jgi:hypothetical protein